MNVSKIKLKDEWRALNLKIGSIQKTIKQNNITDSEYLNWVSELIKRRDYLTPLV